MNSHESKTDSYICVFLSTVGRPKSADDGAREAPARAEAGGHLCAPGAARPVRRHRHPLVVKEPKDDERRRETDSAQPDEDRDK